MALLCIGIGSVGPVSVKTGVQVEVDWRDNVIGAFACPLLVRLDSSDSAWVAKAATTSC